MQNLITECKQIHDDSNYNAEAHYFLEHRLSKRAYLLKTIPAVITVLSAFGLLIGSPNWLAWITLLSGIITILNIFMDPEKKARDHEFAAKNFTILKHEARSLHESFRDFMSESDFLCNVKLLRQKYNLLVLCTPPTDEESFNKARERIKKGVHEPDFIKKEEQS